MSRAYLILLLVFAHLVQLHSQTSDTLTLPDSGLIREFAFLPLPVVAARPALGFMYGLAPSASWMMGPAETTHRSAMVSSILYTTKKQFLFFLKTNVFLRNDTWNLLGDWRYFDTSQPTFGLGTGPASAHLTSGGIEYEDGKFTQPTKASQAMDFKFFRFYQVGLKRFRDSRLFLGLGYHLDIYYQVDDKLLDLDTIPPVETYHHLYSVARGFSTTDYTLSGLSLNAIYDTRDNAINPYDGRFAYLSLRFNPTFLGSDQNSSVLWFEYRDYFRLSHHRPRHLLGIWFYGNMITSGNVPYLDLPALGWDQFGRSGRGYAQGRFRGENLMYAEVEYRIPLLREKELLGMVLFLNATTASSTDDQIGLFEYIEPAAGTGLRIMINRRARTNISLDYAWGHYGSHGFYLNVNEVF